MGNNIGKERLAESEKLFKTLLAGMMDGFAHHEIICDDSGAPVDYRFIDVNPAFTRLTGLQREAVIGKTIREVIPDVEDSWIARYGKIALEGGDLHFEDYSDPLNTHFEVHAYATEHGKFATIFRNVSAEKEKQRLQEQMLHEHKVKSILSELFPYFASPFRTIQEICDKIRLSAQELTGSRHAYAGVIVPGTRELSIYSFTGMKEGECRITLDKPLFPCSVSDGTYRGLIGVSLNSCVPFVCNDPVGSDFAIGLPEGHLSIEKYLSVPVMLGDDLVGQIAVANPGRDYNNGDEHDLLRVAEHFALAIQRLAYEEALRDNERKLNDIIESSNSAIAMVDSSCNVIFANSQMYQMFGYNFDSPEKVSYLDLVHPDELLSASQRLSNLRDGVQETMNCERRYLRKSGECFKGLLSGKRSVNDKGEFVAVVMVISDISEFSKMEDERSLLETQLIQAQKMELVGQLAGGIAHDFNNILTGIIGYANLALMPGERNYEYLHNILELSARATHLTQSLLSFSRKQPYMPKEANLNHLVYKMQKIMERLLADNLKLHIIPCPQPLQVYIDEYQIDQVLMNLITNAVQSVRENGVITVQTLIKTITSDESKNMTGSHEGDYAVIKVSDTGAGIPQEHMKRIFEPFFTTKEVGKGTGLGLAVVYGIVERHGGFMLVESVVGEGATFSVYLPSNSQVEELEKPVNDDIPRCGNETVLVADDNYEIRDIIEYILKEFGYTVLHACNGLEAIEQFRKHNADIDLLIFDAVMPEMGGLDAYRTISSELPGIGCIIMSGLTPHYQVDEFERENIAFLTKPLSPKEILKKVREVLDR